MNKIEIAIDNLLVKSQDEISSRLEEIEFEIRVPNTLAKGYCHCVKLDANGNTRVNDLTDFIVERMVDYAIPKKEIDKAKAYLNRTGSTAKILALQKKAKELFVDLKKTGEGGEMLLYTLIQQFLRIPQLISKMSLKTSGNLHYQGVDGVHVKYDPTDDTLVLYWGESKMYKDVKDGLRSCFESLKCYLLDTYSYKSTQERDLQLITSNISENVNDEQLEDLLVRYFDKDDNLSNKLKYKGVCFVGFDFEKYPNRPNSKTVSVLVNEVKSEINNWFKDVGDAILSHKNLEQYEIHVFLIPFPSVEKFRDYFLESIK